ncbi:signal transduction histidine kinase [Anabaenopsis circularis NIES-21]|uniref:Signal transduction histidine kinase n=1 Tax=Anabaenopsis circularis NIES-21 TaxID=1085406 RepID=A0A1Z4GLU7_9CYAN|nr:signal transduction histidine kinase [Anabaenopsis circularis NIES-21]
MNNEFLFTNNPSPIWIYDRETLKFLNVNEAAISKYGYSKVQFLQMQITDLYHVEHLPALLENLSNYQYNLNFHHQCRHCCQNGKYIDVETVTHAIEYEHKNSHLVYIQDITERKAIEGNLLASEAMFRAVAERIPAPLMISRLSDGLILNANQEFFKAFRCESVDIINCPVTDIYHDINESQNLLTELEKQGSLHNYEIMLKRADGSTFWAIASLQHLIFNGESAILSVLSDITEHKNTETHLKEQNEFLQSIFERIPLMIALINPAGQLEWVNQEWEKIIGWKLEDFPSCDLLTSIYPNAEDRQYVMNFVQSADQTWDDFKTKVRDGRIVDTSWTNIRLPNNQIMGIGQDITYRKQTERALKTQLEREQLMRTVVQRIHQSLNLQDILDATVQEVRHLLQVERVIVYQFAPDMSGKVVAESVESGWTVSLGVQIEDTCFQTGRGVDYHQGRKRAIADIYQAGLTNCHIHLLEQFEVKANLVVPILLELGGENIGSRLWGLLVAHQCSSPREWEENQLDLLDQLSVTIAIAIQKSSIFQQAQTELVERQKAEKQLRSALAEKEILLKEVHHRVKNNLQIVSSLLQLQSQTLKDPEVIRVFQDSQNRIDSISLIHKNLYTSPNIGELDVVDYIQTLATSILISYQIGLERIDLKTNIAAVSLNVDQAIACGLIINELISNCLKHAFPNEEKGSITITLQNINNHIEMSIQDNGVGIPNDLDWNNSSSLGLSLVYDLVTEQLEGSMTLERHHGTKFTIKFPQFILQ